MIDQFVCLIPYITKKLKLHHSLYPFIKVNYSLWEHVLNGSIIERYPGYKPKWNYNSQKVGGDILLNTGIDISCKAGQIHPDQRIKISSSRLSRLSDFDKIKKYLLEEKTEDYIACLSTVKDESFATEAHYVYSIYEPTVFDYPNMQWDFTGKHNDLRGQSPNDVKVTCVKAMGWQVWWYLPLKLAKFSTDITIPHQMAAVTASVEEAEHVH